MRKTVACHGGPQPFSAHLRLLQVSSGEEDKEFLSAETTHDVAISGDIEQKPSQRLQDGVANVMAMNIVDALEMVDVAQHQRGTTFRVPQPGCDRFLKTASIQGLRQCISIALASRIVKKVRKGGREDG